MSDTSIVSTSSYDDHSRNYRNHHHQSCCAQYWFPITFIVLVLIVLIILSALGYVLYKQTEKDRERRRIQNEFKAKHGLANKVLDLVAKDGFVANWFKKHKNSSLKIFQQLITEMVEMIFN